MVFLNNSHGNPRGEGSPGGHGSAAHRNSTTGSPEKIVLNTVSETLANVRERIAREKPELGSVIKLSLSAGTLSEQHSRIADSDPTRYAITDLLVEVFRNCLDCNHSFGKN
jgi:hypothetical protein